MCTRDKVVKILQNNKGAMNVVKLSRELSKGGALGFGVEVTDVVGVLQSKGRVTYNPEDDVVRLSSPVSQKRR